MRIAVIVLYENCCCCVERESVAIVLYCCNTRRELTFKLSNETLSKQAEKEKKKKKRSLPHDSKLPSTESDNNQPYPTTINQQATAATKI
jgi:hypothetical protein